MTELEKTQEEQVPEITETEKYKLYTGKIKAFREMLKFLPATYVKKLVDAGKINEVAKNVKDTVDRGAIGFPRVCSSFCEMESICPFAKTSMLPEGEMCPIESLMMTEIADGLMEELIADRGKITTADKIQVFMLAATQTMLSFRISGLIGMKGSTVIEVRKGPGGMSSESEVPNPLIESYTMLSEQIAKHLKALHLTRIERAKEKPVKEQVDDVAKKLDANKFISLLQESGVSLETITNVMRKLNDETNQSVKELVKDDTNSTSNGS